MKIPDGHSARHGFSRFGERGVPAKVTPKTQAIRGYRDDRPNPPGAPICPTRMSDPAPVVGSPGERLRTAPLSR